MAAVLTVVVVLDSAAVAASSNDRSVVYTELRDKTPLMLRSLVAVPASDDMLWKILLEPPNAANCLLTVNDGSVC